MKDRLTVGDVDQDEVLVNRGGRNDKTAHLTDACSQAQAGENSTWIPTVALFDDMPVCRGPKCADDRTVHTDDTNDPRKHAP